MTCSSCHISPSGPTPLWKTLPTSTDNTYKNNLCTSCHSAGKLTTSKYEDIKTHTAGITGSSYWGGAWAVECVTCHSPHFQMQSITYGSDPAIKLASGTISALVSSPNATMSTLTDSTKNFIPDEYIGHLLIPNTAYPTGIYRIKSNTSATVTVEGAINLSRTGVGKSYAIHYGKMINSQVRTPASGNLPVRFFHNTGANSYATSTSPTGMTSICQICHTQTASFNNSGELEGPRHPANKAGTNCMVCHPHSKGFKADCALCHGEPPVSADQLAVPPTGSDNPGKHEGHVSNAGIACAACHRDYQMPDDTTHSIDIGFDNFGSGGGQYRGQSAVNYQGRNGTDVSVRDDSRICTNITCHSTGNLSVTGGQLPAVYGGNKYASPLWMTTAPAAACGSCHGRSTSTGMPDYTNGGAGSTTANSHPRHVVSGNIECSWCHVRTVPAGMSPVDYSQGKHVNGSSQDVYFAAPNESAAYAGGTKTCSATYCHGSAAPQWGGTAPCGSCHAATAETITSGSHQVHLSTTGGRGPNGVSVIVTCDTCHGTGAVSGAHSGHVDGSVTFTDVNAIAATSACNSCHSPGGDYDGVSDASIGAKTNWAGGVYSGGTLAAGKEKWCAGCHDKSPSVINTVNAPNIAGDESGSFIYGTGWGFYKTGHGLPSAGTMPASGGATNGPGSSCTDCHDISKGHIDGDARTFACASGTGGACTTAYKTAYRLKDVAGGSPLEMPPTGTNAESFRLCFSCHTSTEAWLTNNRAGTNFYQEGTSRNDHYYHLTAVAKTAEIDWDGAFEGKMSCITCHNVHGSKNPAMIRADELTGFPSLSVRYGNAGSTHTAGQIEPVPNNITLVESTKLTMLGTLANTYCQHCHGSGTAIMTVSRTPTGIEPRPPVLTWVGYPGFETDGATPDSSESNSAFTFRVTYTDINQDAPTKVQLWIDLNNDGDYSDAGEKIDMQSAFVVLDPYAPYSRGVDYVTTVAISKTAPAGNTVKYRFYAESGADVATGAPTSDSTLTLLNKAPVLAWTGEASFTEDGVNPDYGPKDGSYAFRIRYVDDDGDSCPASGSAAIQVWLDLNGDLQYGADEKFNLNEADPGDTNCTTSGGGKLYALGAILPNTSGGNKVAAYRFFATDGTSAAAGPPVSGGTVTVAATTNRPPSLAWDGGVCRPQGAMPPKSATSSSINFSIRYYDDDNQCPASGTPAIQVWVDLDKSGSYSSGEKFNLAEESPADTDCTTAGGGKVYGVTVVPTMAADDIPYEFHASDGIDTALGAPATVGATVDVIAATYVVRQDGTEDYTTITAAIAAVGANNSRTILVYNGTYAENLTITQDPLTLVSACGASETIITSAVDPVVHFNLSVGSVFDGFTVTGGAGSGIKATGNNFNGLTSTPSIKNSIIFGNGGRGIYGYRATVTITGSEIYDNLGGGVSLYAGSISDSTIRNNSVTGNGGGVSTDASDKGAFTLTNVTIKDNSASGYGGGIYCQNSDGGYAPSFSKLIVSRNTGSVGGGGYFTSCNPTFTNSLVVDNNAVNGGGMGAGTSASTWFLNSTVVNNSASADGGGFYTSGLSDTVNFANSILWGNRANGSGHLGRFAQSSGSVVSAYLYDSIIENNGDTNITDDNYFSTTIYVAIVDGGGNHDADPNFIDRINGDKTMRNYRVQSPSIAIDRAGNTSGKGIPTDDLDGNSRPAGSEDIGAYEYVGAAP
ncbi:MAG: pectinesterase family protein [Nitrospirota bacterium]|nr:pectinesterase family protein [Nitrospirota bacterium]